MHENKEESSPAMQSKNKRLGLLAAAAAVLILLAAALLLRPAEAPAPAPSAAPQASLTGSWLYEDSTVYTFNDKGSGIMDTDGKSYGFTYQVQGNRLTLSFDSEMLADASYTFVLEEDRCTLTGQEGTTGGEYLLTRQS